MKNLRGQRFGRLIATRPLRKRSTNGSVLWRCVCDCRKRVIVSSNSLLSGHTKSVKNPNIISGNVAHGAEETVDVAKAVKALQKMQDDMEFGAPRLEQAFGKQGARAILEDMYTAQKSGIKAMTKQQWAKRIAQYVGSPTLGYEVIKGLAGETPNP